MKNFDSVLSYVYSLDYRMTDTKDATSKLIPDDVPQFPEFRLLLMSDKNWYTNYYATFDAYADSCFGNIMVWLNVSGDVQISQLNGNMLYTFTSILDANKRVLTMLGRTDIDETLTQIFTHDKTQIVSFTPKVVCDNIQDKSKYIIEPERDNFDYILSVERMATLEGPEIRKVRREVRTFEKEQGTDATTEELDLADPHTIQLLKDALQSWEKAFTLTENNEDQQEQLIIERSFQLAKDIDSKVLCTLINGQLEGFIIYQVLPQRKGYVTLNHIKTSYKYRYIFDYMVHLFAKHLQKEGLHFINFEQDIGLEGLRTHKLSFKPVELLEKYSIRPR